MRAENEVHEREFLADAPGGALLLHHAAAHGHHGGRVAALDLLERPHVAEHTVFRVAAHRAGVEQDEIGVLRPRGERESHLRQQALDPLAVGHVLLAAVGMYEGERHGAALSHLHDPPDLGKVERLRMPRGGQALRTVFSQAEIPPITGLAGPFHFPG